jgi:hypothetical protein
MSDLSTNKNLRDDLFAEEGHFEEAVLRTMVRTAKRRRLRRVVSRSTFAALLLLGSALVLTQQDKSSSSPDTASKTRADAYQLTASMPFRSRIVSTSFPPEQTVQSFPLSAFLISTRDFQAPSPLQVITDQELFSFVDGEAVALIHRGPGDGELLFLDSPIVALKPN